MGERMRTAAGPRLDVFPSISPLSRSPSSPAARRQSQRTFPPTFPAVFLRKISSNFPGGSRFEREAGRR